MNKELWYFVKEKVEAMCCA